VCSDVPVYVARFPSPRRTLISADLGISLQSETVDLIQTGFPPPALLSSNIERQGVPAPREETEEPSYLLLLSDRRKWRLPKLSGIARKFLFEVTTSAMIYLTAGNLNRSVFTFRHALGFSTTV
jgi:hypothetical protein